MELKRIPYLRLLFSDQRKQREFGAHFHLWNLALALLPGFYAMYLGESLRKEMEEKSFAFENSQNGVIQQKLTESNLDQADSEGILDDKRKKDPKSMERIERDIILKKMNILEERLQNFEKLESEIEKKIKETKGAAQRKPEVIAPRIFNLTQAMLAKQEGNKQTETWSTYLYSFFGW